MNAFVVLWSNEWCEKLKKVAKNDLLSVVYGGPHQSIPSLGKVNVGDWIYPLRIKSGKLFLIGRMKVQEIRDAEAYLIEIGIPRTKGELWDTLSGKYLTTHSHFGHRIPRNCVDDVAIGNEGTIINFEREIPLDIIKKLTFGPIAQQEKALPLKDNKVSHINLQGHYRRLGEDSRRLLDTMLI